MLSQDEAKKLAGRAALHRFVVDGMKIGLGSGTTSHFFVRSLGEKVRDGLRVTATATSRSTTEIAREVGIEITDINDIGEIDLTIDGPDEIDHKFRMIKGGGACLLWEKIVAHASRQVITICDETKLVSKLGAFPLPVEVVQFGWVQTKRMIERVLVDFGIQNGTVERRSLHGQVVITDSGHVILDCQCGEIGDPEELEVALNGIPGVVENGLFTQEANGMVIGKFDGTVEIREWR